MFNGWQAVALFVGFVIAGVIIVAGRLLGRRTPAPSYAPSRPGLPPAQAFNMLQPGGRYRVIKAFEDYDRRRHEVGEAWTFETYAFLPYEDGLSWFVAQDDGTKMHIRIQWRPEAGEQYEVASDPERYLEAV